MDELLGAGDVLHDGLVLAVLLDERLQVRQRLGGFAVFGRVRLHLARAEARASARRIATPLSTKLVEHGYLPDLDYPPETGGRNATSSPSLTRADIFE